MENKENSSIENDKFCKRIVFVCNSLVLYKNMSIVALMNELVIRGFDITLLTDGKNPYGFHRVQIKNTNIERRLRQKTPHGIFLDVLPLDGAAPDEMSKIKHENKNVRLMELLFESTRPLPVFKFNKVNIRIFLLKILKKSFMITE